MQDEYIYMYVVILLVLYNDQKRKKTDTHFCLVSLDMFGVCSSLGIF